MPNSPAPPHPDCKLDVHSIDALLALPGFQDLAHLPRARHVWRPPAISNPSRRPAKRSKASARGAIVTGWREGLPKELVFESRIEREVSTAASVRQDVASIEAQPQPIEFMDADGVISEHTFDYWIHRYDGEQVMINVKPSSKAARPGYQALLEQVAASMPKSRADRVIGWNETTFSKFEVANADLITAAFRVRDLAADEAVAQATAGLSGWMRVGDIIDRTELSGRAMGAIARAIGRGELEIATQCDLTRKAHVRRTDAAYNDIRIAA